MSYRPITAEAAAALDGTADEEAIARLDRSHVAELARYSIAQAGPAFLQSHPEAMDPSTFAAMDAEFARDPDRYQRLAISDPTAALEVALGHAQASPRSSAPSAPQSAAQSAARLFESGGRPSHGGFDVLERRERAAAGRAVWQETSDPHAAARAAGIPPSSDPRSPFHHPDFDQP